MFLCISKTATPATLRELSLLELWSNRTEEIQLLRKCASAKYLSAERLFAKLSKFLQYIFTLWVLLRKWQRQKFNRHLQNSKICCKISFWIHTWRESKPQINTLPKTKLEVQKDWFMLSENIIHFPIYVNAGRQTVGTNTRTYVQILWKYKINNINKYS